GRRLGAGRLIQEYGQRRAILRSAWLQCPRRLYLPLFLPGGPGQRDIAIPGRARHPGRFAQLQGLRQSDADLRRPESEQPGSQVLLQSAAAAGLLLQRAAVLPGGAAVILTNRMRSQLPGAVLVLLAV